MTAEHYFLTGLEILSVQCTDSVQSTDKNRNIELSILIINL